MTDGKKGAISIQQRAAQTELSSDLVAYVKTYLESELVQPPGLGQVDNQLGTVTTPLGRLIASYDTGTIYDIGCGFGTLLERLATIPAFVSKAGWRYVPVDEEEKIEKVILLANKLKLLNRTTPHTIAEFEGNVTSYEGAQLFFCRNVLHELTVNAAAGLIRNVCTKFRKKDELFIQDLLRFPEGERNHHCWTMEHLASALEAVGFENVSFQPFRSQRGNAWFNLTASNLRSVPTQTKANDVILSARSDQWKLWSALDRADDATPNREALLEALDIDLQLASLTRELTQLGTLDVRLAPDLEKRLRLAEIVRPIENLASAETLTGNIIEPPARFRERGAQLTKGEEFLRSANRLALVYGGRGTGKTTFIEHLLSTRLYDKTLVRVDVRVTARLWPIVENMLSQLGVRLAGDVVSAIVDLNYSHIASAIGKLLKRFASRLVFVIENLNEILDSNGRFIDPDVAAFVCQLARKSGIKIIVSSQSESLPSELHTAAGNHLVDAMHMGRFGTEQTVINLLDDYFDRARAGLTEYPRVLLDAIDRHPLVAEFAGRILQQSGTSVLLDDRFLRELKERLRSELMARLVDDRSRASIEAASEIRIPVPATVLEALSTRESVAAARTSDVLYAVPDRRWSELLAPLGLIRRRSGSDLMPASNTDIKSADAAFHGRISEMLRRVYRADDDPKWLRESYYHQMLSGEIPQSALASFAGRYYFGELIGSAHYCFDPSHDHAAALVLYDAALSLGELDEQALMRRASCMIRTGRLKDGNSEYARITSIYPQNLGIRRSHVDALLFVDDYESAKHWLAVYCLKPEQNEWNAIQHGRAELGLHNYTRAIELFTVLRLQRPDDPFVVTYLARALQQNGDLVGAITVLEAAKADFGENVAILTSLGFNYERARRDDVAFKILVPLFSADASNTRAALSLVRLYLRANNSGAARKILSKAEKQAPDSMRSFAVMAHAEVLIYDRNAAGAAEYLRANASGEEATAALLIDALLAAAEDAGSSAERMAFLDQAASVPVPARLAGNVPVQIVLARLAAKRRDRGLFDAAISNLAQTRIELPELDNLKALWS